MKVYIPPINKLHYRSNTRAQKLYSNYLENADDIDIDFVREQILDKLPTYTFVDVAQLYSLLREGYYNAKYNNDINLFGKHYIYNTTKNMIKNVDDEKILKVLAYINNEYMNDRDKRIVY